MTTTTTRILGGLAAAAIVTASLAGCSLIPLPFNAGGSGGSGESDSELVGTTWSGTDSDGDSWGFEFQADGTIGLEYNGENFDDASDTWSQVDDIVTISVAFDNGDAEMIGDYAGLNAPMETTGTYPGGTFTLTLERD